MPQTLTLTDHIVAVYATHDQAESAIKSLNSYGFNMRNLSIVGQNYATEEHPVGFVNTGDRVVAWGKLGAFWGSIWGLLFGSAMVFVPEIGVLAFAGWSVAALEGAVIGAGLGAASAALASIGIPKDSIVNYEVALKAGNFMVLAHGDEVDAKRAQEHLQTTGALSVNAYSTTQGKQVV
jgi:uncharacterized membrane protein